MVIWKLKPPSDVEDGLMQNIIIQWYAGFDIQSSLFNFISRQGSNTTKNIADSTELGNNFFFIRNVEYRRNFWKFVNDPL